jgi:PAS domain S-box-containing protein
LLRVLLVEHDPADMELCVHELTRAGYDVHYDLAATRAEFIERLQSATYDIVLADYRLPSWTGMDALTTLQLHGLDIPLVLVTGTLGEERAVDCVKQGVADYVLKQNLARLPMTVRRALRDRAARAERSRADALIRMLTLAVDQSPAAAIITDLHGTIQYVNQRFVQSTGYSVADALGNNPRMLKSGKTPASTYADLWRTIRGGHVWEGEILNRRKDGELYWNTVSISPVRNDAGVVSHYLGIQLDVTDRLRAEADRRSLEAQFQQAQKMEAVGRLAGGVAHDFNNLLTVIMSYVELMTPSFAADDSRLEDLDQIRQAARTAAGLTRQLLAFSRQQVIQPRLVVLEEVVGNSRKMLQRIVGEDVEVMDNLAERRSTVMIDPGQLEQVIMNLAVNARDAMPHGGRLIIETGQVELDESYAQTHLSTAPGRFALLAVSDTGIGMDQETQARIFEPFFTTKEVGKGTGLGLATVYGIVKQSGGFVWVYSEPGKGATFKIYLPLVTGASSEVPVASHQDVPRGTETVLIAEDSPAVRAAVRETLQRYGYSVVDAPNGQMALAAASKHPGAIDLLITDVVMPEMSGSALAQRFALIRPHARVLYVSGYTNDAVVRHGVSASEAAFIQKPFSPEALARKVREVLDSPAPAH